ncbi:MAG: protein kinase [Sandaracinaceae bacterium]
MDDEVLRRLRAPPEGTIDARFELLDEAGTGGMGTVYRARDLKRGGLVALKVLAPTEAADVERFHRERAILAELSHPAIVGYVDAGTTDDDEPYLAMEWLDGESLAQRLARGPLPWREAVVMGARVAAGLEAAHERGVIHRDLKPNNLYLRNGRCEDTVILDFGVARLRRPQPGLTKTGMVIGTPGYMSPEQARGRKDLDERTDVFALGCVLYRAIGGKAPFPGEDVLAILARLVLEEPTPLSELAPDVPPALEGLIVRMMAKDPEDRPSRARDVAERLARILGGELELPETIRERRPAAADRDTVDLGPARESLPSIAVRSGGPRRDARWVAIGAAVGGLALTGIAVALVIGLDDRTDPPATTPLEDPAREPGALAPGPLARQATVDAWSSALLSAQREDGSFGIERQRTGRSWTTAQVLFALATAAPHASAPDRGAMRRGASALIAFEPGRFGDADDEASTAGAAWAVLAFHALAVALDDPSLDEHARLARSLLLPEQRDDGGFRYALSVDGVAGRDETSPYATVVSAWALGTLEPAQPSPESARACGAVRGWLERALSEDVGEPPVRATAGLAEQALHALLTLRGIAPARSEEDRDRIADAARRMVARCMLEGGACRRPRYANGMIVIGDAAGGSNFAALWQPWTTIAAGELATSEDPSARGVCGECAVIAAWGRREMVDTEETLAAAPSYQLAESLLALVGP